MIKLKNKKIIISVSIIGIIFITAFLFFQFTPFGYRMTVPYRNFIEIQSNVYVEKGYSGSIDEIKSTIDTAADRVSDFWGEIQSSPVIIISDNDDTIASLGGDHNTLTTVFFRAYSYIAVSDEYLNTDVIAHEMMHAELHARIYKGKLPQTLIPVWFDEGIATQCDYREQYSEEEWVIKTDNGADMIDFNEMDTAEEFYGGDVQDRRFRYLICRHELKCWIENYGTDALFQLIERVNAGENFYELYNLGKMSPTSKTEGELSPPGVRHNPH